MSPARLTPLRRGSTPVGRMSPASMPTCWAGRTTSPPTGPSPDAEACPAREGAVAQFLEPGAALPTRPAVHEAVREVNPAARVAYVDFDPVAVVHSRALLAKGDGLAAFQADLTDPEAVLADPELAKVLDLTQPVGVILGGVAHFLSPAVMRATTATYVSRIRPGSWLMISAGHAEDEGPNAELGPAYTAADSFRNRHQECASFFPGTELVR